LNVLPPPAITTRFDVVTHDVCFTPFRWSLLAVRDTNRLLEAITPDQFEADGRLPYWADLWASSPALAGHLRQRPGLAGKKLLELGCGLGLAGIAAAQAGATVLMTDYEEDALAFARFNAAMNLERGELSRVTFRCMDWRIAEIPETFDIIIGADIAYERRNFEPILSLVRRLLRPGGAFLLADPDRDTGRDFVRLAGSGGFSVSEHRFPVNHRGRDLTVILSELLRKEEG
jgi:predicted nicotinamide N-methyase